MQIKDQVCLIAGYHSSGGCSIIRALKMENNNSKFEMPLYVLVTERLRAGLPSPEQRIGAFVLLGELWTT